MKLDFEPIVPCEGQVSLFTPPPPITPPVPIPDGVPQRRLVEHPVTIEPVRTGWRACIIGTQIAGFGASPHVALARLLGQSTLDPAVTGTGPVVCHKCGTANALLAHSSKGSTHVAWYCETICAPPGARPTRKKTR